MMVLGSGAFGSRLSLTRGALVNGISALETRGSREILYPFDHVRTQREDYILKERLHQQPNHAALLIVDFQLPEL